MWVLTKAARIKPKRSISSDKKVSIPLAFNDLLLEFIVAGNEFEKELSPVSDSII
jgi:hypothetical protein